MGWVNALAIVFCATTTLLHLLSTFLAAKRFRNKGGPVAQIGRDPVTIIRPVRGLDEHDELTLQSSFELHYPNYELIFCCEDADDAAVAVVNRLMAAYPKIPARLLIGANKTTANPKLNNLIKGWDAAAFDWVILADCNVLLPHDCIERFRIETQIGKAGVRKPFADSEEALRNRGKPGARCQQARDLPGGGEIPKSIEAVARIDQPEHRELINKLERHFA